MRTLSWTGRIMLDRRMTCALFHVLPFQIHFSFMIDSGIGRLLVASLHQGIADLLPTRLEFYESWLHPSGLREGRIGLRRWRPS